MPVKLATYARGTATSFNPRDPFNRVTNPDDKPLLRVGMSATDVALFPTLRANQHATFISGDLRDAPRLSRNDQWFHVVLRYESVGAVNADRADWVEFLRVIWVGDSNDSSIIGLRDIAATGGEVTTRPAGEEWNVAEGDVVSVTLVTMAVDLDVLQGITHTTIKPSKTDTLWLGDSLKRFDQIYGKQVYAGEFLRLGTAISGPRIYPGTSGSSRLFVPPEITGGSDADNTLALRGDQTLDGCLVGTFCVTEAQDFVDDYPMVGGEFGDAFIISSWVVGTLETSVTAVVQHEDYIDAVLGDAISSGGDTLYRITVDGAEYTIRNVQRESITGEQIDYVVLTATFPNTLTLAAFREYLGTLRIDAFAKSGTMVMGRGFADAMYTRRHLADRLVATEVLPTEKLRIPGRDRAPGLTDDETFGFAKGDLWLWTAENTIYVCMGATEGGARWVSLYSEPGGAVLFNMSIANSGDAYSSVVHTLQNNANFAAGHNFLSLNNGTRVSYADFAAGTELVNGVVRKVRYASDTTFTALNNTRRGYTTTSSRTETYGKEGQNSRTITTTHYHRDPVSADFIIRGHETNE